MIFATSLHAHTHDEGRTEQSGAGKSCDYHACQQNVGIRHSVGGADYGTVRAAAFMGLALISAREEAAHPRPPSLDGRPADPAKLPLIGGS